MDSPEEREREEKGKTKAPSSPRIFLASAEDKCLTGEIYHFKEVVHAPFPDSWKQDPSETKAA
jgi:hypothetical protein